MSRNRLAERKGNYPEFKEGFPEFKSGSQFAEFGNMNITGGLGGVGGWSPKNIESKLLFWGKYSEISGGQMPNKVTGSSDYLTVSGSVNNYTYQTPNTAPYVAADTDYIWFTSAGAQRTVTTAELVGYDLQRTPVKYQDDLPNYLEEIIILKSGEILTAKEIDELHKYMRLPVFWSGTLNPFGIIKSNRVGQELWTPLTFVSAVVNDASPTDIVVTFAESNTTLVAADFNVPNFTINTLSRDVTNKIFTLTLSTDILYQEVVTISCHKTALSNQSVTNNTVYRSLIVSSGTGVGVSTLRLTVSSNVTLSLEGNARFYSDAGGTLDESLTFTVTPGAIRTIYLKNTSGTSKMRYTDVTKVTQFNGWTSAANASFLNTDLSKFINCTTLTVGGNANLTGTIPSLVTVINFNSSNIYYTYSGDFPAGLTALILVGGNMNILNTQKIPSLVTNLTIGGNNIDLNTTDFSGNGNIASFGLTNWRKNKITSTEMLLILASLTNRVGNLPATVTINDYLDYAAIPAEVTAAVNTLKSTKSVITVNLGA